MADRVGQAALDAGRIAGRLVTMEPLRANARDLTEELDWLARVIHTRFRLYFGEACEHTDVLELDPPALPPHARYRGMGVASAFRIPIESPSETVE